MFIYYNIKHNKTKQKSPPKTRDNLRVLYHIYMREHYVVIKNNAYVENIFKVLTINY